ncbi:hypothetical protein D918_05379 [Trichuris suis]|nr:hypothetical protein D918_05379 [Trichuris suis]
MSQENWKHSMQLGGKLVNSRNKRSDYSGYGSSVQLSGPTYGQVACCTCQQGLPGLPGKPGEDGCNGKPGNPGPPGKAGKNGRLLSAEESSGPCQRCPQGPPGDYTEL